MKNTNPSKKQKVEFIYKDFEQSMMLDIINEVPRI